MTLWWTQGGGDTVGQGKGQGQNGDRDRRVLLVAPAAPHPHLALEFWIFPNPLGFFHDSEGDPNPPGQDRGTRGHISGTGAVPTAPLDIGS